MQIFSRKTSQALNPGWIRWLANAQINNFDNEVILIECPSCDLKTNIPCTLDYNLIIVIDEGRLRLRIDMQEYEVGSHDCLFVFPEQVFEFQSYTPNYRTHCILMSTDFVSRLNVENGFWIHQQVCNNPHLFLNAPAYNALITCYKMLKGIIAQTDNPHRAAMLHHLIKCYYYGLGYYLHQLEEAPKPSRNVELTNRFMKLLQIHVREQHNVAFYADLLHLSPKYLSACVKSVIGYSAMQCIEQTLLRHAQALLIQTDMTIAQITQELHFFDQSAFGKYFRNHLGISPKQWRAKYKL
ncbi:MAG: helix-turn-helix domain-containing protein [Paludibacteraceae bacterium]